MSALGYNFSNNSALVKNRQRSGVKMDDMIFKFVVILQEYIFKAENDLKVYLCFIM